MAERKATKTKASKVFTEAEKSAMQARAREAKAKDVDWESEVLAKIAEMPPADQALGRRLHSIITAAAPALSPRLWYGMPAYTRDGKLVCHFQPAVKFKTRYATIGFSDNAKLDDGSVWPVAWAVKSLTGSEEAKITALVKKAAG